MSFGVYAITLLNNNSVDQCFEIVFLMRNFRRIRQSHQAFLIFFRHVIAFFAPINGEIQPKNWEKDKNCQNPFQAIRLKKWHGPLSN